MIKLSPYHEIFYNEWKLNSNRSDYNIVFDNDIFGIIDPIRLHKALQRLSLDHFLLQSNIIETGTGWYWVEQPEVTIEFDYIDTPQTEAELLSYVKMPFNLEAGPLLRIRLVKIKEAHFRLIIVVHHIIMDGAKVKFIFNAIPLYYNDPNHRFDLNISEQRKKLNILSRDLENELILNQENHIKFWRTQLSNLAGADIRFLKNSRFIDQNKISENEIGEYLFNLDKITDQRLRLLSKRYGTTPYLFSQAVFAMLLYRYSGQNKFALCYLVGLSKGADFIYGVHVNPVIIPYHFSENMRFIDVLNNAKNFIKQIKTGKHQYFPIQRLLPNFSHNFLTVGFTQTDLKNRGLNFDGISKTRVNTNLNIDCSGKLLFSQENRGETHHYRVMYEKQYIDIELLKYFVENYKKLFDEISGCLIKNETENCIIDYRKAPSDYSKSEFFSWNKTKVNYSAYKTLHQLFEDQAALTPDKIALVYENTQLTYRTLNESANRLAHKLKNAYSIEPDDLIGLCLDRNYLVIVAILAILKTGAAYVPIDPSYPDSRIQYILNDTQAKCVLTNQCFEEKLTRLIDNKTHSVFVIDAVQSHITLQAQSITNPQTNTALDHLAYVIYTSGTTGQPKGVMIEHRSVINLVHTQANIFKMHNSYLQCLSVAPFVFDAHVWEIFAALCYGHCLHLTSNSLRKDICQLSAYIQSWQIDIATIPPALLSKSHFLPLKILIVAGENTDQSIIKYYLENGVKIINAYGPTEATVCATIHPYRAGDLATNIGKPIANTQVYVLDQRQTLLPSSAIGELHIGGICLARGYLNQPTLTAQKFIPNPFQTMQEKHQQSNTRLYKTGDFVRYLRNGDLEYLGRVDDQIKIRGMRVELTEIKNQLSHYPGIQHSVVINQAETKNLLIAYYVSPTPFKEDDLHCYLSKKLPTYMLPHAFIHLHALPITLHGKLDKTALPQPIISGSQRYAAPRNELENIVCTIYAEILELPKESVGIGHDFFELGGNSITAITLAAKISTHLKINVNHIFEFKTPEKLVQNLEATKNDFQNQIKNIKAMYINTVPFVENAWTAHENIALSKKKNEYYLKIKSIVLKKQTKNIKGVLLTGGTGHLGCNLLEKLLNETSYHIYLPVRADSQASASDRINRKFYYYFEYNVTEKYPDRITIFASDLAINRLGLCDDEYRQLIDRVDSIIHCAALIKHQGDCEEFYQANVQATENLLELSKLTREKDFHYISTVSVLSWGYIPNKNEFIFTEEDDAQIIVHGKSHYVKTKHQAEILVQQYRSRGVQGSIYRVGNLAMHSVTHRIQENNQNNLFFSHLKAMVEFCEIPNEICRIEISPVDCTALAIIRLFNQSNISNRIHHVFNPYAYDLRSLLTNFPELALHESNLDEFIKKIFAQIQTNISSIPPHILMIYQMLLQEMDGFYPTKIRVSQEKTQFYLAELGFTWPIITSDMLLNYMKNAHH